MRRHPYLFYLPREDYGNPVKAAFIQLHDICESPPLGISSRYPPSLYSPPATRSQGNPSSIFHRDRLTRQFKLDSLFFESPQQSPGPSRRHGSSPNLHQQYNPSPSTSRRRRSKSQARGSRRRRKNPTITPETTFPAPKPTAASSHHLRAMPPTAASQHSTSAKSHTTTAAATTTTTTTTNPPPSLLPLQTRLSRLRHLTHGALLLQSRPAAHGPPANG